MNKDLKMKTAFTLAEGATHVGIFHNIGGTLHRLVESFTHVGIFHNTRRVGFTLAEVLITLGIIGIVSALTIPNLINKFEEKRTVTLLKETYSMLSQAMIYVVNEHGPAATWRNATSASGLENIREDSARMMELFKPYIKILKTCDESQTDRDKCWGKDGEIYDSSGNLATTIGHPQTQSFILNNGSKVTLWMQYNDMIYNNCVITAEAPCGNFFIKTDNKDKNVLGKNVFKFAVYSNIILPEGNRKARYKSFANNCYQNGAGCTAWVIENGNMDYLHCDDLSWNGKRKCD